MARCSVMCLNGNLIKIVEEEANYTTPFIEYRPLKDLHAEDSLSSESTSNEEADVLDSVVSDVIKLPDSLSSENTSTNEPEVFAISEVQDIILMPVEDESAIFIQPSRDDYSKKKMDIEIEENYPQAKISAVFSLNCLHEKEVTAPEVYIKEETVESENEIMHLSSDESESDDRMFPDNESEAPRKIRLDSFRSLNVENSVSAESPSNVEEPDDLDISEVPDLIIMPVSPPEICIKQEPVESDFKNPTFLPDKSEPPEKGFLDSGSSVKNPSSVKNIPSSSKRPHPEILDISEVPDLVMQPVDNLSQAELLDISKSLSAEESKNCPASSSAVSIPRNVFRGIYNFRIKFRQPKSSDRSPTNIYCEFNKKLYVAKHQPFEVLVCAQSVPPGAVIKVCAAFSKLDYQNEIVVRCPTHAQIDYLTGRQEYDHLVQCVSPSAFYLNNNGVRSVAVPYEAPPAGQFYTSYVYKLTCFSSCLGGVYKRPFQLLFTLEKDDTALGRYAVETRVCACPLRDSRNEIKKEMPDSEDIIQCEDIDVPEKKNYTITVTDPMLYHFLKEMQNFYEASSIVKKLKKT